MSALETIYARASCRQYNDTTVDKETIEKLIDAAVHAPTAMNTQPWVFGVIQDSDLLKKYSDITKKGLLDNLDKIPAFERYRDTLSDPNYHVFYNAPALVVIYAKPGVSPAAMIDCSMAAENLMLAAREMGLGTCWIGFATILFNSKEVKQELEVPEDYDAIAPLIIGYPQGDITVTEKNKAEILFWK
jgi:nitroreductase